MRIVFLAGEDEFFARKNAIDIKEEDFYSLVHLSEAYIIWPSSDIRPGGPQEK